MQDLEKLFSQLTKKQQDAILLIMQSIVNPDIIVDDPISDAFSASLNVLNEAKTKAVINNINNTIEKKEDHFENKPFTLEDTKELFDFSNIMEMEAKVRPSKPEKEKRRRNFRVIGPINLKNLTDPKVKKYCLTIGLSSYCQVNDIVKVEDKRKLLEKLIEKTHEHDNMLYKDYHAVLKKFDIKDVKVPGVYKENYKRLKLAAIELRYLNA